MDVINLREEKSDFNLILYSPKWLLNENKIRFNFF